MRYNLYYKANGQPRKPATLHIGPHFAWHLAARMVAAGYAVTVKESPYTA